MVGDLLSLGYPCVDVNMLVLCFGLERLADVHMVKLLAVHVEEVSVSLEFWNVRSLIKIA